MHCQAVFRKEHKGATFLFRKKKCAGDKMEYGDIFFSFLNQRANNVPSSFLTKEINSNFTFLILVADVLADLTEAKNKKGPCWSFASEWT